MYKGKKIIAIVPAREKSKRIKDKNMIDFLGKPLIQWTIEAAKKSRLIDFIMVSTDSKQIAVFVEKLNIWIPFLRPKYLATDSSRTIDVIISTLNQLRKLQKEQFDYIVLLQPTQPLRQNHHIDEAISFTIDYNIIGTVSVVKVNDNPIFIRSMDDSGKLANLLDIQSTVRSQDLPQYYKVDGSIYVNEIESLSADTSLNDNEYGYEIDQLYSCDIDTWEDLDVAKSKMTKILSYEEQRN